MTAANDGEVVNGKGTSESRGTEAQGSRVMAGQNVQIKTTDDITIHGSDVAGKNVALDAGKDIHITSAENTYTGNRNQTSKGGSIGVSFDMASGIPNNVGGNVYAGKGKTEETITTHQGSHVTAADTLTMKSGKDTDIKGSQVSGNKINADIQGNLTIESEQNKQTYREENKQSGAGFTTDIASSGKGLGGTSISGGANKSNTHSNYESVTEQAGIYVERKGLTSQ